MTPTYIIQDIISGKSLKESAEYIQEKILDFVSEDSFVSEKTKTLHDLQKLNKKQTDILESLKTKN